MSLCKISITLYKRSRWQDLRGSSISSKTSLSKSLHKIRLIFKTSMVPQREQFDRPTCREGCASDLKMITAPQWERWDRPKVTRGLRERSPGHCFVRDFLRKQKMEELLCCKGQQVCRTRRETTSNEHRALLLPYEPHVATLFGEKEPHGCLKTPRTRPVLHYKSSDEVGKQSNIICTEAKTEVPRNRTSQGLTMTGLTSPWPTSLVFPQSSTGGPGAGHATQGSAEKVPERLRHGSAPTARECRDAWKAWDPGVEGHVPWGFHCSTNIANDMPMICQSWVMGTSFLVLGMSSIYIYK